MNSDEAQVVLEVCLQAVSEQYVEPLMLALGTLTTAVCHAPEMAAAVAAALQRQADSCPADVSGRILLQSLARLADGTAPLDPADIQAALRTSLRLLQGGKDKPLPQDN
jgi:hypothetical protein